jgi:hypothetical protein
MTILIALPFVLLVGILFLFWVHSKDGDSASDLEDDHYGCRLHGTMWVIRNLVANVVPASVKEGNHVVDPPKSIRKLLNAKSQTMIT